MAYLIGMSGEIAGKRFDLDREQASLGRSDDNTISLDDPAISGRHCAVVRDGRRFLLRDLGSTNGTRLNSRDVKEAVLKPKDLIKLGSIELMFDSDEEVEYDEEETARTQVEVAPGPAAAPQSFNTISPFGARGKETSKSLWIVLIVVIGLLALIAVGFLFYKLVTTG